MKYTVIYEKGQKSWGAYIPDLPGCVAVGDTKSEVKKLIREAIEMHLDTLREGGQSIPKPESFSELVEV